VADVECTKCGACCVAPDIAALDKPLGVPCVHLGADDLCTIYETRPAVCRSYRADRLCADIAAPTRDERVRRYLAVFGLEEEAAHVAATSPCSMRAARAGS
jgi:Fe-S-cluster containining protein